MPSYLFGIKRARLLLCVDFDHTGIPNTALLVISLRELPQDINQLGRRQVCSSDARFVFWKSHFQTNDKSEKLCGRSRLVAKNWVGARFSGFCTIWAIYPRRAVDMRLTSAVKWPKRRSGLLCLQYC
jgi:hypothetical protein